jgi:microcystin degradation protein MlrC
LIDAGAKDALVAIIKDPDAAAAAHKAGIGANLELALGAGTDQPDIEPVRGRFVVERLTDGRTIGTGPMQRGNALSFGPTAVLRINGVRVIVTSRKAQVADQAVIRHTGLDPAEMHIIVVKSSVHFRADYQPIAREVLVVKAPGPVTADLTQLAFRHLRPGVDLRP